MNPPQRTYGIDLLRGIAAFSVLVFHYLSRGPRSDWITDVPLRSLEPVARYGFLGVDLFFMVSGYVIFMSAIGRTPRAFVASRVARLYPALWVAATITWLLTTWRGDPRFAVTWVDWLWNLTLIPQYVGAEYVDGAYWSLAVELQFYLMVWLAIRTKLLERSEWLLAGWLLVSLADAIRPMYPVERWLVANYAPLFTIGAVTFLAHSRGWTAARVGLLMAAVPLGAWHSVAKARRMGDDWNGFAPDPVVHGAIVVVLVGVFLLVGTGRITIGKTRWATIPGELTYPLYLIHQNAGFVLYQAMVERGVAPSIALAVIVVFAVTTAVAIHRLVEEPLGPVLRRLVSARKPAAVALEPS
ncbi:MAG: acyltransferase [Gemmatimonadaceae bacterium]|nr:acyltransferase [Gemmatimonadaceae bacterium]